MGSSGHYILCIKTIDKTRTKSETAKFTSAPKPPHGVKLPKGEDSHRQYQKGISPYTQVPTYALWILNPTRRNPSQTGPKRIHENRQKASRET